MRQLLVLILGLGMALATDVSGLQWLGFSPDGRYLAFGRSWIQDGSGFLKADISLVEVAKNRFMQAPVAVLLTDQDGNRDKLAGAQRQARAKAAPLLRRYLINGQHPGQRVLYRPMQQQVGDAPGSEYDFSHQGKAYRLRLEHTRVPPTCPYPDLLPESPHGLKLILSTPGKTQVLQRDLRLPPGRACTWAYRVERAYVLGESIAVFVQTFSPGFEGPNVLHMVVTGRLEQP